MPIIRKILKIGNSKAITLPATWLEFYERNNDGLEITEVALEVDKTLTITPILPKKEVRGMSAETEGKETQEAKL